MKWQRTRQTGKDWEPTEAQVNEWLNAYTITCDPLSARISPEICANEHLKAQVFHLVGVSCYNCPTGKKYTKELGLTHDDIRWPNKVTYVNPKFLEADMKKQRWWLCMQPNKREKDDNWWKIF